MSPSLTSIPTNGHCFFNLILLSPINITGSSQFIIQHLLFIELRRFSLNVIDADEKYSNVLYVLSKTYWKGEGIIQAGKNPKAVNAKTVLNPKICTQVYSNALHDCTLMFL